MPLKNSKGEYIEGNGEIMTPSMVEITLAMEASLTEVSRKWREEHKSK